ncbi:capsule assembly Wzi family protein [Flavimarina sp. Hel_I_48]|uniref:capsule assembly Wzi family protein n=1 Tax=Flavimarina sp. Hel_I_48 TaxID=1392488 RepID=UPI0004DF1EBB|nr:capsule assembly Wzi family protein [Flavimarina sp. Hel_I_48]
MRRWCALLLSAIPLIASSQENFYGSLSSMSNVSNSSTNPFWTYANKYGRLDKESTFFILGEAGYGTQINSSNRLEVHGGLFKGDGSNRSFRIDQLYAKYTYKNILLNIGSWHRSVELHDLSSVGGDIIWSGNARALPGAELQFLKGTHIFNWLEFKGKLGHYFLGNDRYVENAQVHYKNLTFVMTLSEKDLFTIELDHYAQFGGTSKTYGKQPSAFSDYLRIFIGSNGGAGATESDQANALGNHLGSYTFTYDMQRSDYDIKLYHQTIFEDTSGREFRNFPDGVWGIYFKPQKKGFVNAFLYEFVQTVSQSGKFVPPPNGNFRGGDNYFNNSMYQSGWTYKGRIIGLPFIIPNENGRGIKINRSFVHHLGLSGSFYTIEYTLKTSYVRNLGTYNKPFDAIEEAVYSYLGFDYPTKVGVFKAQFSADFSNQTDRILAIGFGYRINF